MSVSLLARNHLKRPVVLAMFNSAALTAITGQDSIGNESIYEGWHPPEQIQVTFPYITYRINWYPAAPVGFIRGTMVIDVWDSVPMGNDARRTEEICSMLAILYTDTIYQNGLAVVRCSVVADEWIEDQEPGRIHRQLTVDMRAIDLVGIT